MNTGGGLLGELISLASAVGAAITALAYYLDKRKRRAEVAKTTAEAGKSHADSEVAISGTTLAWAQRADARAEAAIKRADTADAEIVRLREEVAALRRSLEDCQDQVVELTSQLAACPGGAPCPNRSIIPPPPPNVPRRYGA